jgi:pectate lyase
MALGATLQPLMTQSCLSAISWCGIILIQVGLTACGSSAAGSGGAASAGETALGGAPAAGGSPSQPDSAGGALAGSSAQGGGSIGGALSAGGEPPGGGSGDVSSGGTAGVGGKPGTGGSGGALAAAGATASTAAGTAAPEIKPLGYGQGATGGGSQKPVAVSTLAEVQAAIDAYSGSGGLLLQYTGRFDFKTIGDPCVQHTLPAQTVEIKNKSEISILGADGSAGNFGIHIAGASSNIIVRNMTLGLTPGGGDSDLISLEGMSSGVPKDIWIDHNELFTSMAVCAGAGDTAFDGMIDVKKGADNITVSYNYLHDHHKVSLNGYTDDDNAIRHITFHHNLFENIGSRAPLQRHGYSHVLNNYFSKVLASCVNVRMGGYALVEANYFENVLNPVTARDSSAVGYWDLRANNLASAADVAAGNRFGITWDAGNAGTLNASAWLTTAPYPTPLGYSYEAQPFQCIHDGLRQAVGAGKGLVTLKCR